MNTVPNQRRESLALTLLLFTVVLVVILYLLNAEGFDMSVNNAVGLLDLLTEKNGFWP